MKKTTVIVNLDDLKKFCTTTVRIVGTDQIGIVRGVIGKHESLEFFVIHTNPRVELIMHELEYSTQSETCVQTRQKIVHEGVNELLEEPIDIHGQVFINGTVLVSENEDGLLVRSHGGLLIEDFDKFVRRANTISTIRNLCVDSMKLGVTKH